MIACYFMHIGETSEEIVVCHEGFITASALQRATYKFEEHVTQAIAKHRILTVDSH